MSEKVFFCECGKGYTQKGSLTRHQNKMGCQVWGKERVKLHSLRDTIRKLREQLKRQEKIICEQSIMIDRKDEALHEKDEIIKSMISTLSTTNPVQNITGSIHHGDTNTNTNINITTSQLKSLLLEHSLGDPVEKITDMSQIFDENTETFLPDIAYDFSHNILHKTIGDCIIKLYKKEDPQKQAIWNTDTSRQNYIVLIRHAMGNQKVDWVIDKNGIHITDKIINPILAYLKAKLEDYVPSRDMKSLRAKEVMIRVVKEINDSVLSKKINKYIAGYFYMTDNVKKAITYKKKKPDCKELPNS